jgi:threonine dehydrogenase-like Zn-dependent dehydrogenase
MSLRTESLRNAGPGVIALQAVYSGVSRGTERLVLNGEVPASESQRMRCPHQEGEFPFPVKYGYCLVGRILEGATERIGEMCFALAPHQDFALLPADAATPLPPELPPRRAVLAANMETALNVTWDSGAGIGDRVLVVGAGVLGLLIATLLDRVPGTEVTITDVQESRRQIAQTLGLHFASPENVSDDNDITVNASASAAGLRLALARAGLEGRVVEASWHGNRQVDLPLGEAFHARRLALVSSQVGRIPTGRTPRWSHERRLSTALRLLADLPMLDALITHEIAFEDAPIHLPSLINDAHDTLCIALRYGDKRS